MRQLKKQIVNLLEQENFKNKLYAIHELPQKKSINLLISLLCSSNQVVKQHAIIALGEVVEKVAECNIEEARNIMRRLSWSLNEESGWIGWGSAEAMAEIMTRNKLLAKEYHNLLMSYVSDGENYLLFDELRKEVYSALKRLATVYPELVSIDLNVN